MISNSKTNAHFEANSGSEVKTTTFLARKALWTLLAIIFFYPLFTTKVSAGLVVSEYKWVERVDKDPSTLGGVIPIGVLDKEKRGQAMGLWFTLTNSDSTILPPQEITAHIEICHYKPIYVYGYSSNDLVWEVSDNKTLDVSSLAGNKSINFRSGVNKKGDPDFYGFRITLFDSQGKKILFNGLDENVEFNFNKK